MGIEFRAEAYVEGVLTGEVVACRWVRLAAERHRRDLETGAARGLWFDAQAAKVAVAFFGVLRHWEGEWAGQPIVLEPWQQFVVWSLFGWKRRDGTRRFRKAYLEMARKNGKTTLAAGIGLFLAFVDGEPGAQVYSAATKRDQARISHRSATEMVRRARQLQRHVGIFKDNLHSLETASKFEPLGRDADSTDGLNVHGVIADEVHAWKGRGLWDVLDTATGSRRQPLMVAITTAGFDRQSLCWELHEYAEKLLQGVLEDDSFFGVIYTLDEGDDYGDEAVWGKANPNLGVSKKWDDMRRKLRLAREIPSALNAFLRLELCIWTQVEESWLSPDDWAACGAIPGTHYSERQQGLIVTSPRDGERGWGVIDGRRDGERVLALFVSRLAGRKCYAGLDLSSTTDITALVYVFPPVEAGEPLWVLARFFVPEESAQERERRDRVPYLTWARQGYITLTPGNVVDYGYVMEQLKADRVRFQIPELAFDRWGSQKLVADLEAVGFTVDPDMAKKQGLALLIQFGQGFASMSGPMKELEKLVLGRGIGHGGNPVLAWMAANVVARQDPAGNVKPDKARSREKIDGVTALIMAEDRALRHGGVQVSVYEGRGLRMI